MIPQQWEASFSKAGGMQEEAVQTRRAHKERLESGKSAGVSGSIRTKPSADDSLFGGLEADGTCLSITMASASNLAPAILVAR